jgi:hypothetical protein
MCLYTLANLAFRAPGHDGIYQPIAASVLEVSITISERF